MTRLIFALITVLVVGCRHDEKPAPVSKPKPIAKPTPATQPVPPPKPEPVFSTPIAGGFAVLFTSSVEGYVEPCGCTAEPLGGVARFAALRAEAEQAYPGRVFFVDGGDLLFETAEARGAADLCQDQARTSLLLDTYKSLGLDATVVGEKDLARGAAFRDEALGARGLTSVGAAFHVVERGGVRLAIAAYQSGQEAALDEALAALGESDALKVLLSQAPREESVRVLASKPVDIVVQGEDPGETPRAPERMNEGGPIFVAAGAQAQHIGVLEVKPGAPLVLDDRAETQRARKKLLENRIKKSKVAVSEAEGARKEFMQTRLDKDLAELATLDAPLKPLSTPHVLVRAIPLTRERPSAPVVQAALEAYEAKIPELVAKCEANVECEPAAEGAAVYVGVESCFACHRDAVKFWRQQKVTQKAKSKTGEIVERVLSHAKAWRTLEDINKDTDRSCIGCHSVGFEEPGGYCKASEVEFRINVQCESCHGPGSLHVAGGGGEGTFARTPDESTCRGCHKVPHIPTSASFVYKEKLKSILGPGHGEARLNEILSGD